MMDRDTEAAHLTAAGLRGGNARNLPTALPWSFKEVHERVVRHDNGILLY